jgi:hypothetical protein
LADTPFGAGTRATPASAIASPAAQPVHITYNVTTPDADSFRRSEGQVAALLARAVAHGQRNL